MDNFNSVDKRSQHVCNWVARTNINHLAKIKLNIQKTISKLVRLLRIQQLQQRTTHITFHTIESYFVYFVYHNHRILALQSLYLFNEDSWLTVDISSFASFDMHRVILSTHWNNCGRTFQTLTNTFCYWCLTNTWWSSQKQYHSFLTVNALIFCYKFQNALFSLTHTIMWVF